MLNSVDILNELLNVIPKAIKTSSSHVIEKVCGVSVNDLSDTECESLISGL